MLNHYHKYIRDKIFLQHKLDYHDFIGKASDEVLLDLLCNNHPVEELLENFYEHKSNPYLCTWIEVHGKGIWGQTQRQVDTIAKEWIKYAIQQDSQFKDRMRLIYNRKRRSLTLWIYVKDLPCWEDEIFITYKTRVR